MSFRPLMDRLLVEREQEKNQTEGGLFIPDAAKEKPLRAKVLAVGNGTLLENGALRPLDVKPGDTVLFGRYAGTELQVDGKERLILREEDVLGVED